MRLTLRHRFAFARPLPGGLDTPQAWDALRGGEDSFGLPARRADWEAAADRPDLARRAADVAAVAESIGAALGANVEVARAAVAGAAAPMLERLAAALAGA